MFHKDIQKEIKVKTDLILPQYKGKIETGGNIFHRKKNLNGSNVIFQSVLNYNVFPINCSLMISNDILSYNFATCSDWFKLSEIPNILIKIENINFEAKQNDEYGRFQISNKNDIQIWVDNLKEIFDKEIEKTFLKYQNLNELETLLNYNILNFGESDISGIEIFLGLIASKLLNKPYFENMYENLNANFIKNEANFKGSIQYEMLNKVYSYLKTSEIEKLTNLEYLKSQFKNN